ncbi:hypothetical protein MKZ38_010616 [Zalerion maritima]|uniref:Uncharacterized protein n=1 Tax=Zalerion maritima TaxID=339359 RepID=A0AAD5RS43_9PEZI|nr:hypothetical protein MKZ38_010616 [Zalerion maritima]
MPGKNRSGGYGRNWGRRRVGFLQTIHVALVSLQTAPGDIELAGGGINSTECHGLSIGEIIHCIKLEIEAAAAVFEART